MKNILIVYAKSTSEILNRKSAIGSYIFNLAQLLNTNQASIFINGIPVDELNAAPESSTSNPPKTSGIKRLIPGAVKSYLREKAIIRLAEKLYHQLSKSKTRYDHVIEFYTIASQVGVQIAALQNCPLTLVYDNPVLEEYSFFNGKARFSTRFEQSEKKTIMAAESIVTYSGPVADHLRQKYPGLKAQFSTHQNIDFSRFRFISEEKKDSDTINICFVGSFLKWHRTDMLVTAFDQLYSKHPKLNVQLYMVGDGMERQFCEQIVKELNNSNIHFTGFLDGEALTDLQKKMHIGIMPGSNWYGAPNKIFEYGAMNMAVIAPATPTISFLFNSNELCFFELNDAVSFSKALQCVVLRSDERESYAYNLHKKIVSSFSAEKTKLFYEKLCHL